MLEDILRTYRGMKLPLEHSKVVIIINDVQIYVKPFTRSWKEKGQTLFKSNVYPRRK